jgi:hypothetical protein
MGQQFKVSYREKTVLQVNALSGLNSQGGEIKCGSRESLYQPKIQHFEPVAGLKPEPYLCKKLIHVNQRENEH